MKNKRLLTALLVIAILALGIGIGAFAASNFGTQSDPLVAKSYLDNVLTPSLQTQYQKQLDEQVLKLEQQISGISAPDAGNFKPVTLASGKTIKAGAGCEIILTSGTATASGSLSDITGGTSIASGSAVSKNHLCIVSTDGGGIKASGSVELLIRGTYTID